VKLTINSESFPLAKAFNISRGAKTAAEVVRVTIEEGNHKGEGECVPYARYGETMESVCAQIEALPATFDREKLQNLMPAGAARNAVDCALWDLEAKRSGKPVWQLAAMDEPSAITTAYTLSLEDPDAMRENAMANAHRPLLKVKLGTPDDMPRLKAVREGAPKARIMVDANEGWTTNDLVSLTPILKDIDVALVEQPLPEGQDEALDHMAFDLPLCADESSHTSNGLEALKGRYDVINIKLDKTGGLTEAIRMKRLAEAIGFRIFVGCMVGTSLGMAPAALLAQNTEFVDLDGPLLLARDRTPGLIYKGSTIHMPQTGFWGTPT